MIIKLTGSTSKVVYKDLPEDDPKQRKPNIDLVKNIYRWRPYYTLEDGLHKTINYFEMQYLNFRGI